VMRKLNSSRPKPNRMKYEPVLAARGIDMDGAPDRCGLEHEDMLDLMFAFMDGDRD
jgi:hypothetical protein